jgi:hypothetical protein
MNTKNRPARSRAFDRTATGMQDGYEVYRQLRHLSGLRRTPIQRIASMPPRRRRRIEIEAEMLMNAIRTQERDRVIEELAAAIAAMDERG